MEVLRIIGKGVGGVIFTVSLVGLIFSIGLVPFTEYENMKMVFSEIFGSQIEGRMEQTGPDGEGEQAKGDSEEMVKMYQALLEMCEGNESIELPISESEETVAIDCKRLREAENGEGFEGIIGEVATTSIFDSFYYKEYDCGFLDCIQTGQVSAVISAQGHEFFKKAQIYLAVGIVFGAAIILVSVESWPARLKGLGWPLALTGVSYLFLKFGESMIAANLPGVEETGVDIMSLVDKMFEPMMDSFLITFVLGIAFIVGGYVLAYKEKGNPAKS